MEQTTIIPPSYLPMVVEAEQTTNIGKTIIDAEIITEDTRSPFIESNTSGITLEELKRKCIVPSFKDSSLTLSHQVFAENVLGAAMDYFNGETFGELECRVSHPISGRTPNALLKPEKFLTEADKTLFFQRFCFCFELTSMTKTIDGQPICLTIGGVRAYNEQNLYANKSPEKLKIFIGWRVKVCSNLMLSCDGLQDRLEVLSSLDIYKSALDLFTAFDPIDNFNMLENLVNTRLSTQEFCNIIGRLRLLQNLPIAEQKLHPAFTIGDQAVNAMVKNYVSNPNFGKKEGEDFTVWNLLQLGNEAVKQSYIDRWLERNQNCTDFALGIQKAINGEDTDGYSWLLN